MTSRKLIVLACVALAAAFLAGFIRLGNAADRAAGRYIVW